MVVTCDIQFEKNSEAVYYTGQVITGKVTLTADKVKHVEAVNLKINGSAETRWKDRGSKNNNDIVYNGQIDYINTVTCLLAPSTTDQAVVIEPGIHTFSFACHIPLDCPSSFEGEYGSIRYMVQVSVNRPLKYDQTFTKGFTVLAIMNLNDDYSLLKLSVKKDIAKTFCCAPCKSNPLQINVELPQTGYVSGQLIPVNISITNNTMTSINEICVRLVMMIKYFSTIPQNSISETKTISKLIGESVSRNCKKNLNYLLPVPATPPTCKTRCNIIQITYRLEIDAKLQGLIYTKQCVHTPVIIGNVPLQIDDMVVQEQPLPRQITYASDLNALGKVESSNEPCVINENVEPWSTLGNIPAPIYMEAIHMSKGRLAKDNDHEYGEKLFVPKYPVFYVNNTTSLHLSNHDEINCQRDPPMMTNPDNTTWL